MSPENYMEWQFGKEVSFLKIFEVWKCLAFMLKIQESISLLNYPLPEEIKSL